MPIADTVLSGGELFDRLLDVGQFSERTVAKQVKALLTAVKFCHDHSVVHRDVRRTDMAWATWVDHDDVSSDTNFVLHLRAPWLPCWFPTAQAREHAAQLHPQRCSAEDCRLWHQQSGTAWAAHARNRRVAHVCSARGNGFCSAHFALDVQACCTPVLAS